MAKLLNGWEMAKKIQSNCKIYVENIFWSNVFMYGGLYETVLKKTSRSFNFTCWNKQSTLEKSSIEIAESFINLAF